MLLMLSKLSNKTQYTARSHEVGKIINMFSNDFNIIEFKTPWFFLSSVTPITVTGSIIILILRLGWPGILCPIIVLILLPLQLWISKTNGDVTKRINVDKDKRVKLTSEIIEGIKFIKLYGWELAFQAMVRKIRNS
jgi:ATP-binding cassette subfamily C (CFTR/MRP) protein 4